MTEQRSTRREAGLGGRLLLLAALLASTWSAPHPLKAQEGRVGGSRLQQQATLEQLRQLEEEQTQQQEQEDEAEAARARRPNVQVGMEAYREVLTSGEYIVGPGDRFLVFLSQLEQPVEVEVLAEGGLLIPQVGRIRVGGLRLRDARQAIEAAHARTVRVGRLDLELSAPRQFPVSVVGFVSRPGVVLTNGVERVSQVLERTGGLVDRASRRNILVLKLDSLSTQDALRLRRASFSSESLAGLPGVERVDLSLYEATGHSGLNPFIEDGDVVVVPARRHILRALEGVRRPDTYEYVQGDRVTDLVTLAMGLAPFEEDAAFLFRYVEDGTRQQRMAIDLAAAVAGDPEADLLLQPGDWLVARARPDFQREATVRLLGEFVYPGHYVVHRDGTPLRQVIEQAGGPGEAASLPKARVVRRVDEDEERDPEFERILALPPAAWDREEKQYLNMRSREKRGEMVVDFVALMQGDESQNILLRPGDVVYVPRSQRTVLVSGQAAYPGAVPYKEDYTVADYVERAGGFGWRASEDVRVIKARTGEIRQADEVAEIEPGDNIWIKEQPVRDWWAIFTQSMQVAGQVATVMLVFITALR